MKALKIHPKPAHIILVALTVFVLLPVLASAEPKATRVNPQRLTVNSGGSEYRIEVEGTNLSEVDSIIVVDASQTGYVIEVKEVETIIINQSNGSMAFALRSMSRPSRNSRLQVQFVYGHQKYLVPAGLFQFDVR
jgi:hypothetical protein